MATPLDSGSLDRFPRADGSGDNCDPERLIQCPFDKSHQIRLIRLPYHLVKCRKNHPELASELRTCPFNATHLIHKSELPDHIKTCEDRCLINLGDDGSSGRQCQDPVNRWVCMDSTEDWDKECSSKPEVASEISPSCRAPRTNPWV